MLPIVVEASQLKKKCGRTNTFCGAFKVKTIAHF
jgi:hypothetical protein